MDETTLYRKRKRPAEAFLLSAVYGAASVSVMLLCGIIGAINGSVISFLQRGGRGILAVFDYGDRRGKKDVGDSGKYD